jgi:hypothetical protein
VSRFGTGPAHRRLLIELLVDEGYPPDHEVIVYEAATLPIAEPRMERVPLSALVDADLRIQSTLVVPPARPMACNEAMLEKLARLESSLDPGA